MPGSYSKAVNPAPKLKDSCDMCSASKVRCNKQKPICSRCVKLGYPCFYSPARRIGRPYPQRTTPSQNLPNTTVQESSGQQPRMSRSRDGSVGLNSELVSSREQHISTTDEEPGESGDRQHQRVSRSAVSRSGQVEFSQPDRNLYRGPSPHAGQVTPISLNDKSNPSRTASSTFEHASGISINGEDRNHGSNDSGSDCVSVSMAILQQLDTTNSKLQLEATAGGRIDAQSLEAAIRTVTTAFRRLSTILICPCSETSEVGLLVASNCLTILEIYGIIISNSTKPKDHLSPALYDDAIQWDRMDVCTKCFQDRPEEGMATLKVLGELPKVAKFVLQFANRYSDREDGSLDSLPPLATFLRSRLQSITNEATYRLG